MSQDERPEPADSAGDAQQRSTLEGFLDFLRATVVHKASGPETAVGAMCTHRTYNGFMSKVIQIRDVPDDVHDSLSAAAKAQGSSLTKYVLRELEQVAARARMVERNAAVIRDTQARVQGGVSRGSILEALHDGRGG